MTDLSRERLAREVRDILDHRKKPDHWHYRVYQPVHPSTASGGFFVPREFVESILAEYPQFRRRLMNPQEVADHQGGTWLPYYAARFPD